MATRYDVTRRLDLDRNLTLAESLRRLPEWINGTCAYNGHDCDLSTRFLTLADPAVHPDPAAAHAAAAAAAGSDDGELSAGVTGAAIFGSAPVHDPDRTVTVVAQVDADRYPTEGLPAVIDALAVADDTQSGDGGTATLTARPSRLAATAEARFTRGVEPSTLLIVGACYH